MLGDVAGFHFLHSAKERPDLGICCTIVHASNSIEYCTSTKCHDSVKSIPYYVGVGLDLDHITSCHFVYPLSSIIDKQNRQDKV